MKVQDFAYRVCRRTMALLEEKQHYKISDDARQEILLTIQKEMNQLLKGS